MADYRDELYEEVDRRFNKMQGAKDHFSDEVLVVDPTPYERPGSGIIQPIGWVENSSPDIDGEASVKIDSDGITILNGALTFIDSFGSTVLTGAGFGTTWYDFITYGVYNATFVGGTTDPILAATIVGSANTDADYADSLSADIPYWIVESTDGTSTHHLARRTHSGTYQHAAVLQSTRCSWRIFQDVPVNPGQDYVVFLGWDWTNNPSNTRDLTRTVGIQWRDDTHGGIGSMFEVDTVYTDDASANYEAVVSTRSLGTSPAPANARYLRVAVEFVPEAIAGDATITLNLVKIQPIRMDRLRLDSVTDASLSSTAHAFQIGPTNGENIIADNNEIMARNNGSASDLRINQDGGNIHLGDGNTSILFGGTIVYSGSGTAVDIAGGNILFTERSDPAAPSADGARLYTRDNGSGKSQLCVRFSSGAVQVIATQP